MPATTPSLKPSFSNGDAVIADGEFGSGIAAVVGGDDRAGKAGVDVLDDDSSAGDSGSGGIGDGAEDGAAEGLSVGAGRDAEAEGRKREMPKQPGYGKDLFITISLSTAKFHLEAPRWMRRFPREASGTPGEVVGSKILRKGGRIKWERHK